VGDWRCTLVAELGGVPVLMAAPRALHPSSFATAITRQLLPLAQCSAILEYDRAMPNSFSFLEALHRIGIRSDMRRAIGSRSVIPDPYYWWIHGIGFSDEAQFAQHLHDAHGVPLDEALSMSEQVDGRYVFYGY
jgi:hypothetical protein